MVETMPFKAGEAFEVTIFFNLLNCQVRRTRTVNLCAHVVFVLFNATVCVYMSV